VSQGHALLTPFYGADGKTRDSRTIYVPRLVISRLAKMNLLERRGKPRLKHIVWSMLLPNCDALTFDLRRVLGINLTGPKWCNCNCDTCRG
jgi:hypothetical protein